MNIGAEAILFGVFGIIILAFLVIDLGFLNRKAHAITTKAAVIQTLFWIGMATGYGGLIYHYLGHVKAADFFSAYLTEKMLSADNLMVILMLFVFFGIKEMYQHRVLLWGIIGAIIFRAIFIGSGTFIVSHIHFVLYFFGAFLIYTGVKLMFAKGEEEEQDFENTKTLQFFRRHLPLSSAFHNGRFFVAENGKRVATTLFLVLCMIEVTDLAFAVDSIPAVFAITRDPFIAFTSNIFAVMGLRALFFIVEKVLAKFPHLSKGIAFVLVFIGGKMFLDLFHLHLSSIVSFGVIIVALLLAMGYSLLTERE